MATGLDDVTLLLGDCLEQMRTLPDSSVDLVASDPPYGTTQNQWDAVIPFDSYWAEIRRLLKPKGSVVLTASQPFTSALISSNRDWFQYADVWDKRAPVGFLNAKKMPLRVHEDICVFSPATLGNSTYNPVMTKGKYRSKGTHGRKSECYGDYERLVVWNDDYYPTSIIVAQNSNFAGKVHPTQKPIALFEYIVRTYSNEGDTVLDPTMGSGTTLVACFNLRRRGIGIERDPDYFETARRRIASAALPLFDVSPSSVSPNPSLAPAPTRPPLAGQVNFLDAIDGGMSSKGAQL